MDFKNIVDVMFKNRSGYKYLSDEDKESVFFIFNRYMAKKYPKQAQAFNDKNIDKTSAMDIWYLFLARETRIPFWFWKGPTKRKEPDIKGWKILQEFLELNIKDIFILCELYPDEVKKEIKRIELIKKEEEK